MASMDVPADRPVPPRAARATIVKPPSILGVRMEDIVVAIEHRGRRLSDASREIRILS